MGNDKYHQNRTKNHYRILYHLFTKIIEEQEFLKGLEHRRAIVIDGVNVYKYEIYTPNFDYPKFNTSRSEYILK